MKSKRKRIHALSLALTPSRFWMLSWYNMSTMSYKNYLTKETIKTAFGVRPSKTKMNGKEILSLSDSSKEIARLIEGEKPFAAIKLGEAELTCLSDAEKIKEGSSKTFDEKTRIVMKETAGYYPTTDKHLLEYANLYEGRMKNVDAIGVLGLRKEGYFVKTYAKDPFLLSGDVLNPILGGWTASLKGKKVLVIYPFIDEIQFQYGRKDKIFKKNPQILPEFDIKLLASPMTMGEETDYRFPSFMRALEEMEARISQIDFDVALVGCGAYGSLLALYIKSIGKKAIQTGGSTQLLFGILGSRWEKAPYIQELQNEYWIRPATKPKGFEKVAGGAYW